MVKVSICIPTYREVVMTEHLLQSIKIQTYKDYEIIVSDDSPNDDIEHLIKKNEDQSVYYFKHQTDKNPSENWNNLLDKCTGEYIKFMFQDDFFTSDTSLEKMVELITMNDSDFAFSGTNQVSSGGSFSRCITENQADMLKKDIHYLYCGNYIGAPSATIFKNNGVTFDERLCWLVDVEFYINYLEKYPKIAYTADPLISIGIHEEQTTNAVQNNAKINIFEYGLIFEKYNLNVKSFCKKQYIKILAMFNHPLTALKCKKISSNDRIFYYLYKMKSRIKEIIGTDKKTVRTGEENAKGRRNFYYLML